MYQVIRGKNPRICVVQDNTCLEARKGRERVIGHFRSQLFFSSLLRTTRTCGLRA